MAQMSLFNTMRSPFRKPANRGLLFVAAVLVLGLAAFFGLSDADKRYNNGVELLEEGRFEGAIAEFDNAILLEDSLSVAFHNRELAKESTGRLTEAIEDYTQSIKLDPDLALAYANRGVVYNKSGDFQNVFNDLTQAVRIDAKSIAAQQDVGWPFLIGEVLKRR